MVAYGREDNVSNARQHAVGILHKHICTFWYDPTVSFYFYLRLLDLPGFVQVLLLCCQTSSVVAGGCSLYRTEALAHVRYGIVDTEQGLTALTAVQE